MLLPVKIICVEWNSFQFLSPEGHLVWISKKKKKEEAFSINVYINTFLCNKFIFEVSHQHYVIYSLFKAFFVSKWLFYIKDNISYILPNSEELLKMINRGKW